MLCLSLVVLLLGGSQAAFLTPRAGLAERQVSSIVSSTASEVVPKTLAWSSAFMDGDNTICTSSYIFYSRL